MLLIFDSDANTVHLPAIADQNMLFGEEQEWGGKNENDVS